MKKLIITILFGLSLTNNSRASGDAAASALVSMALVGTIYSINSVQYDEWLKSEMESWKYDETDLTSSLSRGCDANLELRLHRNRRMSWIVLVVHNEKKEPIILNTDNMDVTFPNGAVRKMKSNHAVSDYKIDPGWTIQGVFPISEKAELANFKSMEVRLPFIDTTGKSVCELKGVLNRNDKREVDYLDYNRLLTVEFSLFYGNNLLATNSLKATSDKQGLFGILMNIYAYKNSGFTVGYLRQDLKKDNELTVKTARNLSALSLSETNYLIGYAVNFLHGRQFSTTFGLGLLGYTLEDTHEQNIHDMQNKTGEYINANFNYIYYSSDSFPYRGDYMVGLGFLFRNIPKFHIGNAVFGGASLAPYLDLNIGF
ncbi:MAG: hypothetical protein WC635_12320 [Bacteriovorax sp.]|jgi:hypothetical protein